MAITPAAKKHLAELAEQRAKAEKKAKDGDVTTKTATTRKPRKSTAKKTASKSTKK